MLRPLNSSSDARPWPMMRGRIAQAPMSQPARPTRTNRKAVLASGVARRMSEAMVRMAPAPTQIPFTAAITGWGQARIALTRSPVMRVKSSSSRMSMRVSGPMISCTSPPDEKSPPAPVRITALMSRR